MVPSFDNVIMLTINKQPGVAAVGVDHNGGCGAQISSQLI